MYIFSHFYQLFSCILYRFINFEKSYELYSSVYVICCSKTPDLFHSDSIYRTRWKAEASSFSRYMNENSNKFTLFPFIFYMNSLLHVKSTCKVLHLHSIFRSGLSWLIILFKGEGTPQASSIWLISAKTVSDSNVFVLIFYLHISLTLHSEAQDFPAWYLNHLMYDLLSFSPLSLGKYFLQQRPSCAGIYFATTTKKRTLWYLQLILDLCCNTVFCFCFPVSIIYLFSGVNLVCKWVLV